MCPASTSLCEMPRRRWRPRCRVRNVGFYPLACRITHHLGLTGFVRILRATVTAKVQGSARNLDLFAQALQTECPPLAFFKPTTSRPLTLYAGEVRILIDPRDAARADHNRGLAQRPHDSQPNPRQEISSIPGSFHPPAASDPGANDIRTTGAYPARPSLLPPCLEREPPQRSLLS